ncbi:MAG: hypothetical protein HKM97_12690, partial [Acidimicrobiia bacterium]|nr:hypothetical protein [Acidimicrobiia bacterium]
MENRLTRLLIVGLAVLIAGSYPVAAQSEESSGPENRFLLTGYGFTTYVDSDAPGSPESFNTAFVPIFLYRVSDKFLFEAELEFEFEDDTVETEVEYAQIDWLAHDNATVVMGKYLTPFGSFIEKLHPAWINKLPTFPLPYQHGQSLVPFGQTGLQVRGGIPIGDGYRRFTYSLFVSNGFQLSEHGHGEEPEPEEDGHDDESLSAFTFDDEHGEEEEGDDHGEEEELIFLEGSSFNGNNDTALGGRVSVIPAQGFEIGASYLSGSYDEFGELDATMMGVDFTYHHDLFDVRAEWLDTETERGFAEDGDPLHDQEVESWYIQPSLRLSVIPAYAFNKVELVARLANLDWGAGDQDQ